MNRAHWIDASTLHTSWPEWLHNGAVNNWLELSFCIHTRVIWKSISVNVIRKCAIPFIHPMSSPSSGVLNMHIVIMSVHKYVNQDWQKQDCHVQFFFTAYAFYVVNWLSPFWPCYGDGICDGESRGFKQEKTTAERHAAATHKTSK